MEDNTILQLPETTGLTWEVIAKINAVFSSYGSIEKVILYGSRAMGNFKPYSDIDLTLDGSGIDLRLLNKIDEDLDDLLLPYKIDLSDINNIENNDLIDHIRRVGKLFYKKTDNNQ